MELIDSPAILVHGLFFPQELPYDEEQDKAVKQNASVNIKTVIFKIDFFI